MTNHDKLPEDGGPLSAIPENIWPLLEAVYLGGIQRGNDAATSYEWGSSPTGKLYDNLDEAIYDWANDGLGFDDPRRVSFGEAEQARTAMLKARNGDSHGE